MAKPTPALVTKTKPDNDATMDVKVSATRTVTYVFAISSAKNLSIPFAVAVGGMVRDEFKKKPKRVSGDGGSIVVHNVDPGAQVALFLNSDAHPSYRKEPVYAVTPNGRDVIVNIIEKAGRRVETEAAVQAKDSNPAVEAAKKADTYSAVLTGDIWMKVSHKYSSEEVDALLASDTLSVVTAAVKKIYEGLSQASLNIVVPPGSSGAAARTIAITFDDGDNPRENINTGYTFLAEGLKRVHPAGYAAVFAAAIDAGINKVAMTSAWRPMLGSIAHRAGLGLDINYVGTTRLNRQELRKERAVDTTNVSSEEKSLLADFEKSKTEQSELKKKIAAAEAEVKRANGVSESVILAKRKLKEITEASSIADKVRKDAEVAWNAERDNNEPDEVRRFRECLTRSNSVAQLFDPWLMDSDNRDNVVAIPNKQRNENEKLHAHHLHITVYAPKIL